VRQRLYRILVAQQRQALFELSERLCIHHGPPREMRSGSALD
jgi:hypothetical protein